MDFNSKYTGPQVEEQLDKVNNKQDILVSGENIKTINGSSILGKGDITVNSATPDWNANEYESGYIKNKPFNITNIVPVENQGEEGSSIGVVVYKEYDINVGENLALYFDDYWFNTREEQGYVSYNTSNVLKLFKGNTIIKKYDRSSVGDYDPYYIKILVADRYEYHIGDGRIGVNYYIGLSNTEDSYGIDCAEVAQHIFCGEVNTLNEAYIPDTITRKSDLDNIKVDWNASKGEAGYIKNRTHYSSSETKMLPYRGDALEGDNYWGGSQEDIAITEFPVTIKVHNLYVDNGDPIQFKDTVTIKDSNSVAEFSYWSEMEEYWRPFASASVEEHNGNYCLKIRMIDYTIGGMEAGYPIEVTISNLVTLDEKYIPNSVRSMPIKKVYWDTGDFYMKPNIYYKNISPYMYESFYLFLEYPEDDSIVNEYIIEFTLGWDDLWFSLPAEVTWLNNDVPEFEPEYTYVISIVNNVAVYAKYY